MENQIRVLIADDQGPTRQGLRALLTLCPRVKVVGEAIDGREAVRMAAKRRPDVVLMDMQMPVMDGLEATKCIKEQWPAVRVIALTMYPRYRSQAIAVGADAFLLKGTPTETLQATILDQRPDLSGQATEV
jgi:DNA-binding NarL/FixJ family response regulator